MTGIVCALPGIIKPTAVAPAFSVPTAEFTNDSDTRLLLHFNGTNGATTTTDDSAGARTAKTVSALGDAKVSTAQSKFGGSSLLLDGTGDYLTQTTANLWDDIMDDALSATTTIEMWIKLDNVTQRRMLIGHRNNGNQQNGWALETGHDGNGGMRIFRRSFSTGTGQILSVDTWYHVAWTINGDIHKLYLDGVEKLNFTYADNYLANTFDSNLNIGFSGFAGQSPTDGYIDELRISNIIRYTSNFTPPTAPFVNDANTLLLLHMDGADASTTFTDDNGGRTAKTITMNSSVLSTTQKKFGTASLYVDGTGGDYVWTDDSGDWDLGNSRTFETWVYINSFTNISRNSPNHIPKLMGHMNQSGTIWWAFGPNTEGGLSLYYWRGANDWTHSTTKDLVTGQWYHIALVIDSSGVAKGYVNGIEYLSETLSSPSAGNTAFAIGAEFGQAMNAYIDEFRVSHVNRYT